MKDKYIGEVGTAKRDEYEYELRMDVFGKMIKTYFFAFLILPLNPNPLPNELNLSINES